MLGSMPQLRLVASDRTPSVVLDDRPRVSLRLLMAASGRCSCDDCLWAFRRGDGTAGVVRVTSSAGRLSAVR
jgi:hypothetical protein